MGALVRLLGAGCLLWACTPTPSPSPETDVVWVEGGAPAPTEPVSCASARCPKGAFCSSQGYCASGGPLACPGTCEAGASCSPFVPGCRPNGCAVEHAWPVEVQKVLVWSFLPSHQGCDFDNDGFADNELGSLLHSLPFAQGRLTESVATDVTTVLFHQQGDTVSLWFGSLAPESARCNPASEEAFCRYNVSPHTFYTSGERATCESWLKVSSPKVEGTTWTAVSEGATEQLLPMDDSVLLLKLARPRLAAQVTSGTHGKRLTNGLFCLAVLPGQLRLALPKLSDAVLGELGGLSQALLLFDSLVHPDLDLDGDGRYESISLALGFETTVAHVRGLTPTGAR